MAVITSNPYFETTISPWTALGGTVVRSTAQAHEGVASGLLTPNGVATLADIRSDNGATGAGITHWGRGWVWCVVGRSVSININWRNSGAGLLSTTNVTTTVAANTWTYFEIIAESPVDTAFAQLTFSMGSTPPAGHLLYVDEAMLSVVSIEATHNADLDSPGWDLSVEDITPGRAWLRIIREDPSGVVPDQAVRGADRVPVIEPTFIITDYEGPPALPTEYVVTVWDDGTDPDTAGPTEMDVAETGLVAPPPQLSLTGTWLKSVSQPALSQQINVVDWNAVTNPGRILGEYDVLGRRNKVVIRDVPGGREGTLILSTFLIGNSYFNSHWQDLRALLEFGNTLLLQTGALSRSGEADMYLEIKSVRRTRVGPISDVEDLTFVYEIDYVEVDRPSTTDESLGLVSWQDILDAYVDWQEVRDLNATWLDVLNGIGV